MIKQYIKKRDKKTYLIFATIASIYLLFHFIDYKLSFKEKDFSPIQKEIQKLQIEKKQFEKRYNTLKLKLNRVNRNTIDKEKLQKRVTTFCDGLISLDIMKICHVDNIQNIYKYLNVAKVTVNTKDELEAFIFSNLLKQNFFVKSISVEKNRVYVEVYKKVQR